MNIVIGHTDNTGTDAVNDSLSRDRTEEIPQFLRVARASPPRAECRSATRMLVQQCDLEANRAPHP
jgi:outer membrane protein OmpA-like peptidoglycan-associated protein